MNHAKTLSSQGKLTRRGFFPLFAAPQMARERFASIVCPWSAQNPRHDHAQIFPLSGNRLLLVWCEYYVRRPGAIFRNAYSQGGAGDDAPCQISARVSKDRGRTWSEKITLQENFGVDNVKHPNLLRLASGRILFSFTVRDIARKDLKVFLKRSDDEGETWDKPVAISPPGGVFFTNADHIIQHSSGRIILPSHWGEFYGKGDHYVSLCLYSDDDGATWRQSSRKMDLPKRGAEEPAIIERKDGSLLALLRTSLGKVYQSVSKDRGETWSDPEATVLPSPSSASCVRRIPGTGDLLFLWNNAPPEQGQTHYPRNPLTAAISRDEGRTWQHFRDIENRPSYSSAYPSLTFVGDEALITYYHSSRSQSRDCDLRLKILPVQWFYES